MLQKVFFSVFAQTMSATLFGIDMAYHYTGSHALIRELCCVKHDLGALLAPHKPDCVVVKQAHKMAQMWHQIQS